jgi:hypothetical protein
MISPHYPPHWKQLSRQAKEAVNWCCQTCGKHCRLPGEALPDYIARTGYDREAVKAHPRRWRLTVAHLNHDPENPQADLAVLCVPCHRHYDNRQMPRIKHLNRERQGQLSLAQAPPAALEGTQLALADIAIPYEIANPQPGVALVTVATLETWLHRQLHHWSNTVEPLSFLESILSEPPSPFSLPPSPTPHLQALSLPTAPPSPPFTALCNAVPYQDRYRPADLRQACENVLAKLSRLHKPKNLLPKGQRRRFSHKGHASGWLEERQGNRRRKTPTISYYYCWETPTGSQKLYIPMGKVWRCDRMIDARKPVEDILAFLAKQPTRSQQCQPATQPSLFP